MKSLTGEGTMNTRTIGEGQGTRLGKWKESKGKKWEGENEDDSAVNWNEKVVMG